MNTGVVFISPHDSHVVVIDSDTESGVDSLRIFAASSSSKKSATLKTVAVFTDYLYAELEHKLFILTVYCAEQRKSVFGNSRFAQASFSTLSTGSVALPASMYIVPAASIVSLQLSLPNATEPDSLLALHGILCQFNDETIVWLQFTTERATLLALRELLALRFKHSASIRYTFLARFENGPNALTLPVV